MVMTKHFYFLIFLWLFVLVDLFGQNVLPRRSADPVILSGTALSDFAGVAISDIVAFSYNTEQGWVNIPVQVDEKDSVTGEKIYGDIQPEDCFNEAWCTNLHLLKILTYTDASTFAGPDTDPMFDANDELVFMIKDAGIEASASDFPKGVQEDSGIEIQIKDPVDNKAGFVYLFLKDEQSKNDFFNNFDPYVTYSFNLVSGDYKSTFSKARGPNREQSVVSTSFYKIGFSDRWIKDELRIKSGSATGENILDRQKVLFAPDVCERHEVTFSLGEGAFIVNKSGPVRAIRAYMGANSGPLTQREHIFYEQQEVINTWLRVHPIQGIMDFYDYSEQAQGMTYTNNNNKAGVLVDGNMDELLAGKLDWELLTGDQGTLFMQHIFQTHLSSQGVSSYYLDDKNPDIPQCTGDQLAIGSSGIMIQSPISNTDVRLDEQAPVFKLVRASYFYGPDQKKNIPELQTINKNNPVQVKVNNFNPEGEIFKVYPNPFADKVVLEMRGESAIDAVLMWNMVGKLIAKETFLQAELVELNTENLPAGVYILQVVTNLGEQKKVKVVKN